MANLAKQQIFGRKKTKKESSKYIQNMSHRNALKHVHRAQPMQCMILFPWNNYQLHYQWQKAEKNSTKRIKAEFITNILYTMCKKVVLQADAVHNVKMYFSPELLEKIRYSILKSLVHWTRRDYKWTKAPLTSLMHSHLNDISIYI